MALKQAEIMYESRKVTVVIYQNSLPMHTLMECPFYIIEKCKYSKITLDRFPNKCTCEFSNMVSL